MRSRKFYIKKTSISIPHLILPQLVH